MTEQSANNVWAVIPVYNNAAAIRKTATECCQYLEHVLVVDDGSSDANIENLLAGLKVVVLRHEQNRGKGAALRSAFSYIHKQQGDYAITLDGDGQHSPDDIPAFLAQLEEDVILLGNREKITGEMPGRSRFGRRFSDFWVWLETGTFLRDTQSGFRAYPVKYVVQLPLRCRYYDFEIEVIARAAWAGLRFKQVPIKVYYPSREERISSFRPFLDNLRISLIHTRLVGRHLIPWPKRRLVPREFSPSSFFRHPGIYLRGLLKENTTPAGLAISAWIGVFLGALPLIGMHMMSVLFVAARLRLNKAMALAIQNLCMPPIVPGICIAVGYFIRHRHPITRAPLSRLGAEPLQRLWEWVLGSLIVAPLLATGVAAAVYLGARWILSKTKTCKQT